MLPVMWQILHGKHHCWYFCRCKNNNNNKVFLTILLLLTTIGLTTTKPGFFNKILQEISVNILSGLAWQARGGGEVIWGFQNFVLHTWRGNLFFFFFHFGSIVFATVTEHVCFFHLTNVLINFAQPHQPHPHHFSKWSIPGGHLSGLCYVIVLTDKSIRWALQSSHSNDLDTDLNFSALQWHRTR